MTQSIVPDQTIIMDQASDDSTRRRRRGSAITPLEQKRTSRNAPPAAASSGAGRYRRRTASSDRTSTRKAKKAADQRNPLDFKRVNTKTFNRRKTQRKARKASVFESLKSLNVGGSDSETSASVNPTGKSQDMDGSGHRAPRRGSVMSVSDRHQPSDFSDIESDYGGADPSGKEDLDSSFTLNQSGSNLRARRRGSVMRPSEQRHQPSEYSDVESDYGGSRTVLDSSLHSFGGIGFHRQHSEGSITRPTDDKSPDCSDSECDYAGVNISGRDMSTRYTDVLRSSSHGSSSRKGESSRSFRKQPEDVSESEHDDDQETSTWKGPRKPSSRRFGRHGRQSQKSSEGNENGSEGGAPQGKKKLESSSYHQKRRGVSSRTLEKSASETHVNGDQLEAKTSAHSNLSRASSHRVGPVSSWGNETPVHEPKESEQEPERRAFVPQRSKSTPTVRARRRGNMIRSSEARQQPSDFSDIESDYGSDYDHSTQKLLERQAAKGKRYQRRGSVTKFSIADASSKPTPSDQRKKASAHLQPDGTTSSLPPKTRPPPKPLSSRSVFDDMDVSDDDAPDKASSAENKRRVREQLRANSEHLIGEMESQKMPAVENGSAGHMYRGTSSLGARARIPLPGDDMWSGNLNDSRHRGEPIDPRRLVASLYGEEGDIPESENAENTGRGVRSIPVPGMGDQHDVFASQMASTVLSEALLIEDDQPSRGPVMSPRHNSMGHLPRHEVSPRSQHRPSYPILSPLAMGTESESISYRPEQAPYNDLEGRHTVPTPKKKFLRDDAWRVGSNTGALKDDSAHGRTTSTMPSKSSLENDSGHSRSLLPQFPMGRRGSNSTVDSDSVSSFGHEVYESTPTRTKLRSRLPKLPPSMSAPLGRHRRASAPPVSPSVGGTERSDESNETLEDLRQGIGGKSPRKKRGGKRVAKLTKAFKGLGGKSNKFSSNASTGSAASGSSVHGSGDSNVVEGPVLKSCLKQQGKRIPYVASFGARKCVQFGNLQIVEFPIILGDNPAVTSGAPITIDWIPQDDICHSINSYERTKPKRRRRRKLLISVSNRAILLLAAGYSIDDIADASINAQQIKDSRQESLRQNNQWDRVSLMMENTNDAFTGIVQSTGGMIHSTGKKIKALTSFVKPQQQSNTARMA